MVVHRVKIKSSALWMCHSHSLSDSTSSVLGFLYGEKTEEDIVVIYDGILCERRQCEKYDDFTQPVGKYVECAGEYAEKLTKLHGKPLYLVGWYHSHPQFSCEPTHRDFVLHNVFADIFGPELLLMIISVYLSKSSLKRVTKYDLFEEEMLSRYETSNGPPFLRRQIEFVIAKLSSEERKINILPVEIEPETRIKQPNTVHTICELPFILSEEKRTVLNKRMQAVDCTMDNNSPVTDLSRLNLMCERLTAELHISAVVGATLHKFLEDRLSDSLRRKHILLTKKMELEDDIKKMKCLINLYK